MRNILDTSPLPKVTGIYSEQRPFVHPNFVEFCSSLYLILPTNQEANTGGNITTLVKVKIKWLLILMAVCQISVH